MYMQYVADYDVTNISDTRPQKNMITMGKVDTSDLMMMIITWAINNNDDDNDIDDDDDDDDDEGDVMSLV